jgi:hypothetical protein
VYPNRPISEQQAGWHSTSAHRDYSEHEYYLPPGPSYSPPMYERELIIDEENTGTSVPPMTGRNQCSGQTRLHPTQQNSEQVSHARQNGQTRYHSPPPTTQRWSAEYSPEERMRVGLPRWESHDREVQYQQAAVVYEHRNRT